MGRTVTPDLEAEVVERLWAYALEFRPLFPRSDQFKRGRVYLHGLLLDGERKSIEPLSRRVPAATSRTSSSSSTRARGSRRRSCPRTVLGWRRRSRPTTE